MFIVFILICCSQRQSFSLFKFRTLSAQITRCFSTLYLVVFIFVCCSQRWDKILRCNFLFGLIGHFGLYNCILFFDHMKVWTCVFLTFSVAIVLIYIKGIHILWHLILLIYIISDIKVYILYEIFIIFDRKTENCMVGCK